MNYFQIPCIGKKKYLTVLYDLVDREPGIKDNYHVIPLFDGYDYHIADETCICEPYKKEEDNDKIIWVHRLMN